MDTGDDGNRLIELPSEKSTRRRVLLSGTTLAGILAGCSGNETDQTETPTDAPTDTVSPVETTLREPQTVETTTSARQFDTSYLQQSPSSSFAPTDGFGSVSWLSDREPEVLKVINLESSGEGSLPWALGQPGPRIVVFEVGGVIDLAGEHLNIENGDLYVAGQTAPSPGITIIRGQIQAAGSNTLVQHIRVRPGDELGGEIDGQPNGRAVDALTVENDVPNVIFDHCSVSWGSDENMSASGGENNTDITFSNNLIAECLSETPLHEEAEHSKGTLINDLATDTSVIGNVYVHHTDRHPRIKGGSSCVVVNNFVYNFYEAIEMGGGPREPAIGSIVGNYFKEGPASDSSVPLIIAEGQAGARAYVDDNVAEPSHREHEGDLRTMSLRPLWPGDLEPMAASDVFDHNLVTAGARPADRSPHDERIIGHAHDETGERIDSQREVGGYPTLEAAERTLDVPAVGDRLAEWLHQHTRAVELSDSTPP